MTQLVPFQLDDDTVIYLEAIEGVQAPVTPVAPISNEPTRGDLGLDPKGLPAEAIAQQAAQAFKAVETTVRAYTKGTINAFRDLGGANVDKIKLEFGVNVGGEAGVPYVTKGTAECSLKITVECSFPSEKKKGEE